jgi:CheY-like chemotaxis protein
MLRLSLQAAVLRQALIGVISAVAGCARGGRTHIQPQVSSGQLNVDIRVFSAAPSGLPEEECLQITGELLSLSGGMLEIRSTEGDEVFAARITLPVSQPSVVLVVDDNADTLQLFRRYLSGSRYQFIGAQSGRQALALAESARPDIIVLDVMMPEQDGWMLLSQLRENPRTRDVPVIVCTIVPQEQLALLLGAAQFLRKPISRAVLLAALDRQLDRSPS